MTTNIINRTSDRTTVSTTVDEQLFCALTGKPVRADEAFWAPPFVTTRELISTVIHTLFQAPSNLNGILFAEQPNVPYAPEARELLASRRATEQIKLLLVLLVIAALIFAPIIVLSLR
jgi:hypothetical protein